MNVVDLMLENILSFPLEDQEWILEETIGSMYFSLQDGSQLADYKEKEHLLREAFYDSRGL